MNKTVRSTYQLAKESLDEMADKDFGSAPPYSALQQEPLNPAGPPAMHVTVGTNMGSPIFPPNFNPPVGPESTELTCPQCRCRIKTKIRHRSTSKTHLTCLLLSWTFCCCWIPYCMNSCRNANHFCPMCGAFIGTYQS